MVLCRCPGQAKILMFFRWRSDNQTVASPVLNARLQTDPPGLIDAPAPADPHILIHVGPSSDITCDRGGQVHRGLAVQGDIDVIPPGTPSRWVLRDSDSALVIRVPKELLAEVAHDSNIDPSKIQLLNRFQIRDPQIEQLGWALRSELETGHESGRIYLEGLGRALASRLLHRHSTAAKLKTIPSKVGMSGAKLREILSYVEDNLGSDLSLAEIATVSGLSVSQCQRAFRQSVGTSIHRYIVLRRVERAESLLLQRKQSIAEIALEVGFAHQSHLADHMRRLRGIRPSDRRRIGL
jgi:AraC family transcriptional regulator